MKRFNSYPSRLLLCMLYLLLIRPSLVVKSLSFNDNIKARANNWSDTSNRGTCKNSVLERRPFLLQSSSPLIASVCSLLSISVPKSVGAVSLPYQSLPSLLSSPLPPSPSQNESYEDIYSQLVSKKVSWINIHAPTKPKQHTNDLHQEEKQQQQQLEEQPTSFTKYRYRSSSLSTTGSSSSPAPTASSSPSIFPSWMEGYWCTQYKFKGASFPQGRNILSIRTAGAGLGTCLALPNVGYIPQSSFSVHFISKKKEGEDNENLVYEDLAYNIPRKFESFWPQSKVMAVQTNGSNSSPNNHSRSLTSDENNNKNTLSPKCFVNGSGCTLAENPNLHSPSTRFVMDFDAPTRRSGRLIQSSDITLIDTTYSYSYSNGMIQNSNYSDTNGVHNDDKGDKPLYVASNSYSQFNKNQELQTFYKEIISLEKRMIKSGSLSSSETNNYDVIGKVRVAAFLPMYIRDADGSVGSGSYDEAQAVALYDYDINMKKIDEYDAGSM